MTDQPRCFDDFGLSDSVRQALHEMEFAEPTEVQTATFNPILEGLDLMVQARTGTGKTAAFAIPMADRLLSTEPKTQLLGLCPTRELALQVAGELESIGKHRGIKVAAVYGGAPMTRQIRQLEEGVQAVIGTPGRVLDHIRRGNLKLDTIKFLILDEADEMLSMGFEKDITAIIENIPSRRQTLLFSATIPNDIQRLAQRFLNDPQILSLSDDYIGAKEVEHGFYMVSGTGRVADLVRILDVEDPDSAIIFCNTRDDVQLVSQGLKRHGFNVDWISSDLAQSEREVAMGRMRDSNTRFLVATDVAARGIDISHVTHVINYTFPESLEVYIHRTGRTGRMGRTGWAVSLITPRDVGNLYFLKLTYRINPVERELPTLGELAARREADILAKLIGDNPGPFDDAFISLARRVQQHVRGTDLIAALLKSVLGPLETDDATATRRGRSGHPLVAEEAKPARSRAVRRSRSSSKNNDKSPPPSAAGAETDGSTEEQADPDTEEFAVSPDAIEGEGTTVQADEAGSAPANDATFKEIYVSVGRRDGVSAGEIVKLLGKNGVDRAVVDKIRVRDRSTFIGVRADLLAAAMAALDGVRFGDRVALAEPAKRTRT